MGELLTFLAGLLAGAGVCSPVLLLLWLAQRRPASESAAAERHRHRPARGRTSATVLIGVPK